MKIDKTAIPNPNSDFCKKLSVLGWVLPLLKLYFYRGTTQTLPAGQGVYGEESEKK